MSEIASALLGALIGGGLTYFATLRSLYDKSVVSERKRWRDEIRRIAINVVKNANKSDTCHNNATQFKHELAIRLNPIDKDDKAILDCAILNEKSDCKCAVDEFVNKIAILLKHDWERAKLESSFIKKLLYRPHRPSYCELVGAKKTLEFRQLTWISQNRGKIMFVLILSLCGTIAIVVPLFVESHLCPLVEHWKRGWQFMFPPSTLQQGASV